MDDQTLTEILAGDHLNMEERLRRGAWPHPPLKFGDLSRHLARVIEARDWFPKPWKAAESNESVADVTVIERKSPSRYVVHYQRSGPSGFTVAASGERAFRKPEAAAKFYLTTEFNLPGDLDGWRVEP